MTQRSISQRVTIRDVASAAGVSISTVSLYTQGRPGVSDETAQRIAAAIQQLGYVPRQQNGRRSNGRKGQRNLFGLLLEERSLSAFPETIYGAIIKAMEMEAKQHGYSMVLSVIEQDAVPQIVADEQVDGVIILGGCPLNDAVARRLAQEKIPLLLLDTYLVGAPVDALVDAIVPDNEWGGYQAIQHLVALGHQRIGIIEGPAKYRTLTDRLWGALRAAHDLGLTIPPAYRPAPQSSGHPWKGYREMKALLALPTPPTAVFAISDKSAFGAIEAIREAGLCIPDDISLIGFDNEVRAEHTTPPLTTLHLPKRQMGVLAVQRLLRRIADPSLPPVRTCLPTNVIVRHSTKPYSGN